MLIEERIFEIERSFGHIISDIKILEAYENCFKLSLSLKESLSLRIAEYWDGNDLRNYSYYWLDEKGNLIIGWDNADHHKHIKTFPYHKHLYHKKAIQPSAETTLEAVLKFIEKDVS